MKASCSHGKSFGDLHTFIFWMFLPWEGRCSGRGGARSAGHTVYARKGVWRYQELGGKCRVLVLLPLPSPPITKGPRLP